MLIQATKDTKFKKFYFNGHPRYTSSNVHKHTLFLYFSDFSKKKFYMKNKTKQNKKITKQKHVKQSKA